MFGSNFGRFLVELVHLSICFPLPFAFTGGSRKRGKEVVEGDEVVRPTKLTARQIQAQERRGIKESAKRGKKGEQGSSAARPTILKMPYEEYQDLRKENPYSIERNPRAPPFFHSTTQHDIYKDIYLTFKQKVMTQHTIELKKMRAHEEYFGEAFEMCQEFGLIPLMLFNKDNDPELIMQFYATVHFQEDDVKTMRWLTNGKFLQSNLTKFVASLGYERVPGEGTNGWTCHEREFAMDKAML